MTTLYEAAKRALEALENDAKAIECLRFIRCHKDRHTLPREWLTKSDEVIGYWDDVPAQAKRGAAIEALRSALAQSEPLPPPPECQTEAEKTAYAFGWFKALEVNRAALAQQVEQQPVAWLPSAEWTPCVKLPVTVHVRQQRDGETHVSTREGITPVKPDDLIMRGVSGEEYPIGREIFEKTYRIGEAAPAAQPGTWTDDGGWTFPIEKQTKE